MKSYNVRVSRPGHKYQINVTIEAKDLIDLGIKVARMGAKIVRVGSVTVGGAR